MNKPCALIRTKKSLYSQSGVHRAAYNDQSIANSAQRKKIDQLEMRTADKPCDQLYQFSRYECRICILYVRTGTYDVEAEDTKIKSDCLLK